MGKAKRQANFELLRICAMFMVVVLHWLSNSRSLPENGRPLDRIGVTAVFLEAFCLVAVNVYVLISGYFLSEAQFAWRRVMTVICQTLFYTILIPPALALCGILPLSELTDVYRLQKGVFPVQSGHYWFVSAYVVMCLLSPFLNEGIKHLEKKRLQQLIMALLFFFSIGKTFVPLQFATDRYGYDFGWFCVVYLIGGYVRRYGIGFFRNGRRGFCVYAGAALLSGMAEIVLTVLSGRFSGLSYYASVPFHYNYLLCIAGAVGLFYGFSYVRLPEGAFSRLVRWVSPAVFGVYLIHEQADLAGRWYGMVNGLTGLLGEGWQLAAGTADAGLLRFLGLLVLQTAIVFAVCVCVDKVRGRLFFAVEKRVRRSAEGKRGTEVRCGEEETRGEEEPGQEEGK